MEILLLLALGLIILLLVIIAYFLWKLVGNKNKENELAESDDELFPRAKELAVSTGYASPALMQRKLRVGYARAAQLVDMLEDAGVVGERDGAKPRKVLL